jgi:hypothetical protein
MAHNRAATQVGARALYLIKVEMREDTAFVAHSCVRSLNVLIALRVPSTRARSALAPTPWRASISSYSSRGLHRGAFRLLCSCFQSPGVDSDESDVEAEPPTSLPAAGSAGGWLMNAFREHAEPKNFVQSPQSWLHFRLTHFRFLERVAQKWELALRPATGQDKDLEQDRRAFDGRDIYASGLLFDMIAPVAWP